MVSKTKPERDVSWYLRKELKYFLRLYSYATKLNTWANSQNISKRLKKVRYFLGKLKTFEKQRK